MNQVLPFESDTVPLDAGLRALCGIAAYYHVAADPVHLSRELALQDRQADENDIVRAAMLIGLKAKLLVKVTATRLATLPTPAIVRMKNGSFQVLGGKNPSGLYRLVDPISHADEEVPLDLLVKEIGAKVLLVARKVGGAGTDPKTFGFRWFLPTIWRYRRPLKHVLIASLFVQLFGLVTPLFFQVVVDKVLTHKGYSTLFVLVGGMAAIGVFDVVLQYLRTYALSHTTNRIDVELGQRLFGHLLRLPLAYFETRSAGQTVARVRELETVRAFLTGQGLFSAIDLFFAFVFIAVLLAYSAKLTLIVLATIPLYLIIGFTVRPLLREQIKEKFNRGAASQQFLVEAIVGASTIKSAAVQPIMRLSQVWQDFQQAKISIDRLGDILNAPAEPTPIARVALPAPRGEIELCRVTFRYRPNSPNVLTNVSLRIRAGEVIGVVGPSGSGKSTLAKLIPRLYLPNEGRVLLDGAGLSQVDPAWLRRHIGVVLQESLLFNRTVHENIAFAQPAMPRAQVIEMARLAGADEFIDKLPEGYDTMIEERGANLSGGQRQRLAIARALSTNPRILIFDEATSALDYESERLIQRNMRRIVRNRTVVIIAHRLAAVRGCHRIVGMVAGRIVEVGTHEELLKRAGGLYAHLWGLQSLPVEISEI